MCPRSHEWWWQGKKLAVVLVGFAWIHILNSQIYIPYHSFSSDFPQLKNGFVLSSTSHTCCCAMCNWLCLKSCLVVSATGKKARYRGANEVIKIGTLLKHSRHYSSARLQTCIPGLYSNFTSAGSLHQIHHQFFQEAWFTYFDLEQELHLHKSDTSPDCQCNSFTKLWTLQTYSVKKLDNQKTNSWERTILHNHLAICAFGFFCEDCWIWACLTPFFRSEKRKLWNSWKLESKTISYTNRDPTTVGILAPHTRF